MSANNGKYRVGVILGGTSSERAVSLRSGTAIEEALQSQGIPAVKIDPKRDLSKELRRKPIRTAFLALHGKGGEDGRIQRCLEARRIPYTGSSAAASRRAFDKLAAKRVFERSKIPTPKWVAVTRKNFKTKLRNFSFPVFAKPVADGSSIGVHLVRSYEDFLKRAGKIFGRETRLLVEERILGREVTVGIFKDRALPVVELKPKGDFYDYHSKYTKGQTEYLVPAPLPQSLAKKAQALALKTHRALGLRDLSRVDIFLDRKNRPFVLEVNTIPGFTSLSLFPKAAREAGYSFGEICLEILKLAERRGR
jgi:D-alanine-D-alanine ligase